MNKYKLKKNEVYKINLPSHVEPGDILNNYVDLDNFNRISTVLSGFSFDAVKFDSFILLNYIEDFSLDKSLLYFYEEYKDMSIRQLSVKKKIILDIVTVIDKYDCFIFSMEALSISTQTYLFFLFNHLSSYKHEKTFICFDYSKLNCSYEKVEINVVTPSWREDLLEKLDFSE
ncbi:hypothetical protein [uncultured Flavobacterium sp.]|uniref:hypothetical protein n=1 Tax=uncultured Flavobacterium sp. TaxID=165435 RepID=UPI0025D89697|nr:hypothetical protein [uncultured Flavobacterium sp.]